MKDKDGRIMFNVVDKKVWKEHMEVIMNEENEWDGFVEAEKVEGPVQKISMVEVSEKSCSRTLLLLLLQDNLPPSLLKILADTEVCVMW